jgi:RNA polymerase sigma-70 factor (ECF subfamily)
MKASGSEIGWIQLLASWVIAAVAGSAGALATTSKVLIEEKMLMEKIDLRNKEREALFLRALDDHQAIIFKVSRSYCNSRAEQEDLYQEIVYQLWKAYPQYNGESKISTWMYTIALRTAIMPYRRKHTTIEFPGELPDRPNDETPENEKLFELFHRLGNFDRAILALLLEGYAQREIATMLDLRESTINQRMSRLRKFVGNYK